MNMNYREVSQVVLTVVLSLAVLGGQRADAEMRRVALDIYPGGEAAQGHPIRLVFEADFVPGGQPLEKLEVPAPEGTVARFLADYCAVLRGGSVEEALPFWHADERAEARRTLTPVFDKQRALIAEVMQSRLYTRLRYGNYLLAVVRHELPGAESLVAVYPLIETSEGWALSNALQADPLFQLLYGTFHQGLGLDRPFEAVN